MTITVTRYPDAPRRPSTMRVYKARRDGKQRVTIWSCGRPNMFGSYNYSKARTYILNADKVKEYIDSNIYEVIHMETK